MTIIFLEAPPPAAVGADIEGAPLGAAGAPGWPGKGASPGGGGGGVLMVSVPLFTVQRLNLGILCKGAALSKEIDG